MSAFPVAVLIVTYQRSAILKQTLTALSTHLRYAAPLHYVVADDGSTDETADVIAAFEPGAVHVTTERGGLGANANNGLRAAFALSDVVLQLQDDMALRQPLDITPHVGRLLDTPEDGFIRLWGVAGHRYTATLDGMYWRVSWQSDELYIPSDRPHLKHRRFHDAAGFYPVGLKSAETEEAWCHQCRDAARARTVPAVIIPHAVDVEQNFEHIGWHHRWRDQGL